MFKFSLFSVAVPAAARLGGEAARAQSSHPLLEFVHLDAAQALARLGVNGDGLDAAEVETRLGQYGPNIVAQEKKKSFLVEIAHRFFTNPINILLAVLAVVS